jgi:hypothetical protein
MEFDIINFHSFCYSGVASIRVPQAHYVIAQGKSGNIGVLYTMLASCVGLAIVESDITDPLTFFTHIDSHSDVCSMARSFVATVREECSTKPQVLAVTGYNDWKLLERLGRTLRPMDITYSMYTDDYGAASLAMDLGQGAPVTPVIVKGLPEYKPNDEVINAHRAHRSGDHFKFLKLAFDLRGGIPKGYEITLALK